MTQGGCETMIYGVHVILDLHLDWVVLQVISLQVCIINNHFSKIVIFYRYFPICLTILCMSIPTIFLTSFSTQGSQSHFVRM
jgi:hypothetical protein